jgi:hypothetical protein
MNDIVQGVLQKIVSLTNAVALDFHGGDRSTCVLTSYALNNVLQRLGYNSRPLRVEAKVFPGSRQLVGTILGGRPNGCFRKAAGPGMWHGHLAVAIEDAWLLDATVDQANKPEWPSSSWVGPVAVRLNDAFWKEHKQVVVEVNDADIRYRLYPKQVGFVRAGDARPSHWRPLSDMIMAALENVRLVGAPVKQH